nr:hypothetical protein CFP56_07573 [Quercus suber]
MIGWSRVADSTSTRSGTIPLNVPGERGAITSLLVARWASGKQTRVGGLLSDLAQDTSRVLIAVVWNNESLPIPAASSDCHHLVQTTNNAPVNFCSKCRLRFSRNELSRQPSGALSGCTGCDFIVGSARNAMMLTG